MTGGEDDVDALAALALHLQDMLCVDRHPTLVKTYGDVSRLLTVQYTPAFAKHCVSFDGLVHAIRDDPWDLQVAHRFHDEVDAVWHSCHDEGDGGTPCRLERGLVPPILLVLGAALLRRRARASRPTTHPRLRG